ncbi:hypothetical protein OTERR_12690 [Oryzomicrobium terrae]|uniref:Uncharacterized protein n=1 Tax=Oryzomicrobium terrae TaxID=1735038 RepID=A0A5C1E800_9RHOO|nr:hypothetical protein [Oryzomicrobium terrae]QEL64745.1 hypothetical protein OTERR_12690 [Oryzomicrobium terrae]
MTTAAAILPPGPVTAFFAPACHFADVELADLDQCAKARGLVVGTAPGRVGLFKPSQFPQGWARLSGCVFAHREAIAC